jgi:hypothetical protein
VEPFASDSENELLNVPARFDNCENIMKHNYLLYVKSIRQLGSGQTHAGKDYGKLL